MTTKDLVGVWLSDDGKWIGPDRTNATRYVGNSPTNYTDPSGHAPRGTGKEVKSFADKLNNSTVEVEPGKKATVAADLMEYTDAKRKSKEVFLRFTVEPVGKTKDDILKNVHWIQFYRNTYLDEGDKKINGQSITTLNGLDPYAQLTGLSGTHGGPFIAALILHNESALQGGPPDLSILPRFLYHPADQMQLDTTRASPFGGESISFAEKSPMSFRIFDAPSLKLPDGVATETAEFQSYLIANGKVLYEIDWRVTRKKGEASTTITVVSGGQPKELPKFLGDERFIIGYSDKEMKSPVTIPNPLKTMNK